jgi:aminopeptidase S
MVSASGQSRPRLTVALVAALVILAAAACAPGAARTGRAVDCLPGVAPQRSESQSPPSSDATTRNERSVEQLDARVSDARAMKHLQALQKVAEAHGGNRAAGTPGYDASVDYVVGVLRDAGFQVSTPTFEVDGGRGDGESQRNVIAQTRTGDPDKVVMIGAHLDSVEGGPGIVDNGSGVASVLEIATQLGADPSVKNMVRLAFFGDEEGGAVGSTAWVEGLSDCDRSKIKLYLNVDMVASRNAGYFVQGGQGRDQDAAGPEGSATIARVLADQLIKTGVPKPEFIEFVGDDEAPFIEAGIPVGGAENGDANDKTTDQATTWGGQAGQPYDPCYHEACDTIDNVNRDLLNDYLRALAGTVAHFATSTQELR